MPELPEVETVVRSLAPDVVGRTIAKIHVDDAARLPMFDPRPLVGTTIRAVTRVGKQIVIESAAEGTAPLYTAVHLRMTGRLQFDTAPRFACKALHVRARFCLTGRGGRGSSGDGAGTLRFTDTRRFGTIVVTPDRAALEPAGLDPTHAAFTAAWLAERMAGSRSPVKVWLLRQDLIVGLGNIYASEILFHAKVDPTRPARSLNLAEVRRVHRSTRKVLREAIKACGTTFRDFQDAHGLTGSYQRFLQVYAREAEPCRRCRAAIARLVQAQRSTFYCPSCQH